MTSPSSPLRRRSAGVRRRLLAGAALAAASALGCAPEGPAGVLDDYAGRVARVIDAEVTTDPGPPPFSYPARRDLRLELEDVRIGLLDFVALHDCGLQELVGQRNSGLGRVMPPSQRLLYEHRLLVAARRCVDDPDADEGLGQTLGTILPVKAAQRAAVNWNATFAAPEMARLFSLAGAPLPLDGTAAQVVAVGSAAAALEALAAIVRRTGDPGLRLHSRELEAHYQALQAAPAGGDVLQSLRLLTATLDGVAEALESRRARRPLCFGGVPSERGEILHAVFTRIYAPRVQPYLAHVHRQARRLLGAVDTLRAAATEGLDAEPAAFAAYAEAQLSLEGTTAAWPRFEAAIGRHSRAWQGVFDECGLAVGAG